MNQMKFPFDRKKKMDEPNDTSGGLVAVVTSTILNNRLL